MTSYKKILDADLGDTHKNIEQKLAQIRKKNVWEDILDADKYAKYDIVKHLCGL